MKRTEIEAQARVSEWMDELEWLKDYKLTINKLLLKTDFRVTLLEQLIKEEQKK